MKRARRNGHHQQEKTQHSEDEKQLKKGLNPMAGILSATRENNSKYVVINR